MPYTYKNMAISKPIEPFGRKMAIFGKPITFGFGCKIAIFGHFGKPIIAFGFHFSTKTKGLYAYQNGQKWPFWLA